MAWKQSVFHASVLLYLACVFREDQDSFVLMPAALRCT